jgi:dihydroorotate dehydrogenase (fumarate)
MADLSTKYMGLDLRNPVVVASCSLVNNVKGIRRCADAGAGAIVLKSLFEEQIQAEAKDLEEHLWLYGHSEAFEYVSKLAMPLGPREYLNLIEKAKSAVSVPIIASLNCISARWWTDYAKQLDAAGADGLELNISVMPSDPDRTSEEIENLYLEIVETLKASVKVPIAVKFGSDFTSVARMAGQLAQRGASALVLFNRYYQIDIDIEKVAVKPGYRFSSPDEMSIPLRWIALLAGRVGCDLAASTGVHDGAGVIKQLLAGATVVQLCSTLYLNGVERIGQVLKEVEAWMESHAVASISDMRGTLSQMQSEHPELYERLQYIKALVGIE